MPELPAPFESVVIEKTAGPMSCDERAGRIVRPVFISIAEDATVALLHPAAHEEYTEA